MFPKLLLPLTAALFVALSASTAETYDRVIYGGIAGAVAAAILALDANIPPLSVRNLTRVLGKLTQGAGGIEKATIRKLSRGRLGKAFAVPLSEPRNV